MFIIVRLNLHRIHTVYFRWMGILALVIQVTILSYAVTKTKFNLFGNHTLSDLGRTSISSIYAAAFTLGGICLLLFVQYLYILYRPKVWFIGVFVTGIVCLIIVGSVPDQIKGHISDLHTAAALILIASMALIPKLFSLNDNVPLRIRRGSRAFFYLNLLILVPIIGLALAHRLLAFSELLCLIIFDTWLIFISVAPRYTAINNQTNNGLRKRN